MRHSALRGLAFAAIASLTLYVPFSLAQPRPPGPPAVKGRDGGAGASPEGGSAPGTRPEPVARLADGGAAVTEARGDGGKVLRFGEVEIEGRLKSPQIVYFLRRVRAEFATGDLGHRSFQKELSETRNEPSF